MAKYRVLLRRSVLKKDLARIPKADVQRIIAAIRLLSENPRPPQSIKLSGAEQYRLRQGNYRIVYSIQDCDQTVWIVKAGHRREVYRHRSGTFRQ